jgi:hypothetical protein
MVFGGGSVFGGTWGSAVAPGFGLEAADVPSIGRSIKGCAVTVEHGALEEACKAIGGRRERITRDTFRDELAGFKGQKRQVGEVLGGRNSDVLVRIGSELTGLNNLVREGVLSGLSLTTVTDDSGVRPIELTLTATPKRGTSAKLVSEYIGLNRVGIKAPLLHMSAAAAAETAPPMETAQAETPKEGANPLEDAYAHLDEKQREALVHRFKEYEEKIASLTSENGKLAETNGNLAKVAEFKDADREIMKHTLDGLLAQIAERVPGFRQHETKEMMLSSDENIHNHGQHQLVAACSKAFETFAVPAPAAASEAPPPSKRACTDDVRNLLRANFAAF